MRSRLRPSILMSAVAVVGLMAAAGLAGCDDTSGRPIEPSTGVTTGPVTHRTAPTDTTFEGFPVISVIPASPKGIVFVFHGSHGSASLVDKIESTDVLNELEARGYGWVATESTERDGDQRWDVNHSTLTTNPDLARLDRLWTELVNTTPITTSTPMFGIGMSNGSRFVSLWAWSAKARTRPIKATAMVMGTVAPGVGTAKVPTLFVIADNDTTTSNSTITSQYEAAKNAGSSVSLMRIGERPITASRLARIPGMTSVISTATLKAIDAGGITDAKGARTVPAASLTDALLGLTWPASTAGMRPDIGDQVMAAFAAHQFNAEAKMSIGRWFDQH